MMHLIASYNDIIDAGLQAICGTKCSVCALTNAVHCDFVRIQANIKKNAWKMFHYIVLYAPSVHTEIHP